ncbi:MAG: acyl--CoA ligase [Thermoanaerobaculia bacterium]|nr:acyl--CoA ligase [Thermoanaerobaculia bacterium]
MSKIYRMFQHQVAERGSEIAIVSQTEGLRLSFDQVLARTLSWQQILSNTQPGSVALATGNCSAFLEIFLALCSLGRSQVTLDGAGSREEKLRLSRNLGCSLLIDRSNEDAPPVPPLEGAPDSTVRFTIVDDRQPIEPPPGTVLIKTTSGSTGHPTGVCLSEDALVAGVEQIGEAMQLTSADRVLIAIPMSHSYGFDNGVLSLAILGTPLILESPTYLRRLLQTLVEEGATFLPTVPPLVHFLSESEWPTHHTLRRVICAGGRLDRQVAQRFRETTGLPIHQFYGSTETGGITFEADPTDPDAEGSVGHPLPRVDIQLGPNGEVEVRSAANHGGRLGEARELIGQAVRVGDLAEWTPGGRLRITGRAVDFVNVSGRRVSIPAVEDSLRAIEGVIEAAVLGTDDPVRGERLVAFVVGDLDRIDGTALPTGLGPRDIRRLDALPYTERGKLDRNSLRRIATEGS